MAIALATVRTICGVTASGPLLWSLTCVPSELTFAVSRMDLKPSIGSFRDEVFAVSARSPLLPAQKKLVELAKT